MQTKLITEAYICDYAEDSCIKEGACSHCLPHKKCDHRCGRCDFKWSEGKEVCCHKHTFCVTDYVFDDEHDVYEYIRKEKL